MDVRQGVAPVLTESACMPHSVVPSLCSEFYDVSLFYAVLGQLRHACHVKDMHMQKRKKEWLHVQGARRMAYCCSTATALMLC